MAEIPTKRKPIGLNRVELIGTVANEVKSRIANSGCPSATFLLATNKIVKAVPGVNNGTIRSDFVPIVWYGKLAEIVNQYVKKGDRLYVEATLDGFSTNKHFIKVQPVGRRFLFLSTKKDGRADNAEPATEPNIIEELTQTGLSEITEDENGWGPFG